MMEPSGLAHALPRIVQNPQDREARSDALFGAWLCDNCLGGVGMALHHKRCHTLFRSTARRLAPA